jgi:uroporphyrinogen decarboxylase
MKRDMTQWIADAIADPHHRALPILSFPGAHLEGITLLELVRHGELQARCMRAIARRYPTLAAVSNMDLSVEAEAFGCEVAYGDLEVPTVKGNLISTSEQADALRVPEVGEGRTGECLEAIRIAVREIPDRPVLAGVIGPFSLAGRLTGLSEFIYHVMDDPDMVHVLLDKATEFILRYAMAFKEAGANGIVMAEPAAGLLSPSWNAEFSVPYVKRIVDAVQDDGFVVVYHNCGNTVPLMPGIVSTGAKAFHFGNAIAMKDVIGQVPPDRLALGNVDPASQFVRGTPESVAETVRALLDAMDGHPNFILSSGCDIPPQAPLENIDSFFQALASDPQRP